MADPVFVDDVTPLNAVNMNKLQTRDEEGQPNGYASLGSDGKVPSAQLPAIPAPGADLDYLGDYVPGTYVDGDIVVKDGVAYMCVGGPTVVGPDPVPWGPAGMMSGYATLTNGKLTQSQRAAVVASCLTHSVAYSFSPGIGPLSLDTKKYDTINFSTVGAGAKITLDAGFWHVWMKARAPAAGGGTVREAFVQESGGSRLVDVVFPVFATGAHDLLGSTIYQCPSSRNVQLYIYHDAPGAVSLTNIELGALYLGSL